MSSVRLSRCFNILEQVLVSISKCRLWWVRWWVNHKTSSISGCGRLALFCGLVLDLVLRVCSCVSKYSNSSRDSALSAVNAAVISGSKMHRRWYLVASYGASLFLSISWPSTNLFYLYVILRDGRLMSARTDGSPSQRMDFSCLTVQFMCCGLSPIVRRPGRLGPPHCSLSLRWLGLLI